MNRQLIWVDGELGKKLKLFCFVRGIAIKDFATKSLQKSLEPYENWLQNIQKLKVDEDGKNNTENIE